MTQFKTILMTAALLAAPSFAFAQVPTDAMTDKVKDKAVETVMDNMTTDDAVIAGKTVLQGGSKEDAAVAVVKNRANKKIEAITGGASMNDLSVDGAIDAGKDMAMEKAKGSSTTYTDKSKTYGMTDRDKAKSMLTTGEAYVIQKSGATAPAAAAPSVTMAPVNCPSGTKDAGDGTCMITGDWKP